MNSFPSKNTKITIGKYKATNFIISSLHLLRGQKGHNLQMCSTIETFLRLWLACGMQCWWRVLVVWIPILHRWNKRVDGAQFPRRYHFDAVGKGLNLFWWLLRWRWSWTWIGVAAVSGGASKTAFRNTKSSLHAINACHLWFAMVASMTDDLEQS